MRINFNLRNASAKQETPINIVIRYSGLQIIHPSGERIHPDFWGSDSSNAKNYQKAKKGCADYVQLNARLDDIRSKASKVYHCLIDRYGRFPTKEEYKSEFSKILGQILIEQPKEVTLIEFFEDYIEGLSTQNNLRTGKIISTSTVKQYRVTLKHLKSFERQCRRKIKWDDLSASLYKDLNTYFIKNHLKVNTIGKQWKNINAVISQAEAYKVIPADSISKFKVLREAVDNIYLYRDELVKWKSLDLSSDLRLERVRDLFFIACYTGSRYSDMHKFSKTSIENIDGCDFFVIVQQKTQQQVTIPVHPEVAEILEKYNGILPKIPSHQKMNEYLKLIGQQIELLNRPYMPRFNTSRNNGEVKKRYEMVTSHTARRTFATQQVLNGVSTCYIMAITGHTSEKDFWNYVKLDDKAKALQLSKQWQQTITEKVA